MLSPSQLCLWLCLLGPLSLSAQAWQALSCFYETDSPALLNRQAQSLMLPDGRVLLYGDSLVYKGQSLGRFALLDAKGNILPNSSQGQSLDGSVTVAVGQADGKILLGGNFSQYEGQTRQGLLRVHADGRLDTSFQVNLDLQGASLAGRIYTLAIQRDGRILLSIYMGFRPGGLPDNHVVRLFADGRHDNSFNINRSSARPVLVNTLVEQPEGLIWLGGSTYSIPGTPALVCLNSDGSTAPFFSSGLQNNVLGLVPVKGDKLLVYGYFRTNSALFRLDSSGYGDNQFNPELPDSTMITHASCDERTGWVYACGRSLSGSRYSFWVLDQRGKILAEQQGSQAQHIAQAWSSPRDGRVWLTGSFSEYQGQGPAHLQVLRGSMYEESGLALLDSLFCAEDNLPLLAQKPLAPGQFRTDLPIRLSGDSLWGDFKSALPGQYSLVYEFEDDCSGERLERRVEVRECAQPFAIYPNPAKTQLSIVYNQTEPLWTRVELFDAQGRLHYSHHLVWQAGTKLDLNPPNLSRGLYYLILQPAKGQGKTLRVPIIWLGA